MIRMLIIGYSFGIRSERKLCEEVHLNLAYRWFCRLGLEDSVPDHSTFSKNRHGRFRDGEVFRRLFESVLQRCMAEELVRGEGFATDASIIKADAQRQRGVPSEDAIDWGNPDEAARPVREYLAALAETNDPVTPSKAISLTDPSATWTAAPGGPAFYAYSTNYLIDLEARQTAPAWLHRRSGRVPAGSNRPKLTKNGKVADAQNTRRQSDACLRASIQVVAPLVAFELRPR